MKIKTKDICTLGLGIALYVVLSATVKIPLIGHIHTDLGYVVFGVYLMLFGMPAVVVGAIGCVFESIIFSGWFPIGWFVGQIVIGIICGASFKRAQVIKDNKLRIVACIAVSVVALFVGVFLIKTIVECFLYQIPLGIKAVRNGIAFIADMPPMIIGVILGDRFRSRKQCY